MSTLYPNPREYIRILNYKSLIVLDDLIFSDLELAIIGYINSSPRLTLEGGISTPAVPYAAVHELIFEYLKFYNKQDEIKDIIEGNIAMLERSASQRLSKGLRDRVEQLIGHFRELKHKDVNQINYSEFQPQSFAWNTMYEGNNPFRKYFQKKIKDLLKLGILFKRKEGLMWYLALNPHSDIKKRVT